MEWNSSGARTAFNIYGAGADEILTRYQVGVGYTHYKSDRMGNVEFLLSETNTGIEKYTYDAFGRPKITDWAGIVRTDSAYGNRFSQGNRVFKGTGSDLHFSQSNLKRWGRVCLSRLFG